MCRFGLAVKALGWQAEGPPFESAVFRDLGQNQLWQWLEEDCRKAVLGVWRHISTTQTRPGTGRMS